MGMDLRKRGGGGGSTGERIGKGNCSGCNI